MKKALLEAESEILDTLQILKNKQLKLCLISNADVIDTAYWSESALSQIFDTAVFSCDAGYLKPDPEIYREALQRMQVRPEQCMFIGDGGSDELKGAKQLGMITALAGYFIERDAQGLTNLREWADYYITDIRDLLPVIYPSL
jgi:putative hydrolase of the HAD superfamily